MKINKIHIAFIISSAVFIFIGMLNLLGVFNFLESKSYDLRVRFMSRYTRPSHEIVVVLLTQNCLDWAQQERGWGWPWPRQAYAEFLDFMNIAGAKTAAFDVLFSEPSVFRNARQDEIIDNMIANLEIAQAQIAAAEVQRREIGAIYRRIIYDLHTLSAREDDAVFARAGKEFGRAVQAVFFSTQSGSVREWPQDLETHLFQPVNFGSFLNYFDYSYDIEGYFGAQFPISELRNTAAALGSVTGRPDPDGVIRRIRLFTLFDGKAVPSLPAAALIVGGQETEIFFNEQTRSIEWGSYTIPVDRNGSALLRFHGELSRYFPYRASDILRSAEAYKRGEVPLLAPENFTDTHVFFGFFAPGLFDIFASPISALYPGIGVHVTMLDNLLQGNFIRESRMSLNIIVLLTVAGLTVFLTLFSHRIPFTISGIIIITAVIVVVSFIAYHFGLWIPMITFIAGVFAAFISATLYNYATEGSQKRFIKSAFSQYLSPKVIDQIIQDPSQLKLGGEKREMTAIFTDVRGFSTFSEALGDPTKLVELLNFYLTKMSNIVLDNQGTIDKYEGDAIIAFFGAPIHYENHASLACRAVIGMKKAEPDINREAIDSGLVTAEVMEAMFKKGLTKSLDDPCQIFTRIGMNTGDMVVGNMGTPNKMDYTIMGNAVNLAARLEGVNKQYDTGGILISEYTRAHIGDEFVLRPLSRVRVVGINTPLRLYELLDTANEASPILLAMVKDWEQAFNLYEKKDFTGAKNIFESVFSKNRNDMTAKMYLERCQEFINCPPEEKTWDNGVDNLTSK